MKMLSIEQAAKALSDGELVFYPTEGVYGVGCDPRNEDAVTALLNLKGRSADKGLILVASQDEQLAHYLADGWQDQVADNLTQILQSWPGPVTWLLPAKLSASTLLRGEFVTQAVRVSAHPVVQALCDAFAHPIVSTSANLSAMPSCLTVETLESCFNGCQNVAGIVEGALGGQLQPTTIRDGYSGKYLR